MLRPSRILVLAVVSVALAALSLLGVHVASAAPMQLPAVPATQNPTPTADGGHGSMPGMDHGSMPGMDHGSMPGMDHGAASGASSGHDEAAKVSRPLGLVLGGFVLVNGLLMAVAAVLGRRTRRTPRRPDPVAA